MPERKRKKTETPIFDSIRKPTAPPTAKFGERRPKVKLRPSLRGAKHKKQEEPVD